MIKKIYKKINITLLNINLYLSKKILNHYGLNDDKVSDVLKKRDINISYLSDYSSPLPVQESLRENRSRWEKPSKLGGIEYDLELFKENVKRLKPFFEEFYSLQEYNKVVKLQYGPGYPEIDAMFLYSVIRELKPKKYLEVGSGVSSFYASLAVAENKVPTQITCIDPFPYKSLYSIPGIEIIKSEVQNVDINTFASLSKGDILFIDSSHILKIDGDVPFLILEILPLLRKGVFVHIHDIPFPYNFPFPADYWLFRQPWPKYWNEAMVLQAFLCYNSTFAIYHSMPLLRYNDEDFLRKNLKNYMSIQENMNTFSSIWLEKK